MVNYAIKSISVIDFIDVRDNAIGIPFPELAAKLDNLIGLSGLGTTNEYAGTAAICTGFHFVYRKSPRGLVGE
jgi:hypothetical protein